MSFFENINAYISCLFEGNKDKQFIVEPAVKKTLSYGEFLQEMFSLADVLKKEISVEHPNIAIIVEHNSNMLLLYFAIFYLGGTVVAIDGTRGSQEIKDLLRMSNPNLVLHDENRELCFLDDYYCKKISDVLKMKQSNGIVNLDNAKFKFAQLISFSSGTTGKPKGIRHSLENLLLSAIAFNNKFNFSSENIFYHNLPMSYMAGILNLWFLPMIAGSSIVIGNRFSISSVFNFWDIPLKYNVNVFWFIPTEIELLLKLDKNNEKASSIKENKEIIACVGTAALNIVSKRKFEEKYGIDLYESYGLSETLFVATNNPNLLERDNSVGEVLQGISIRFNDDKELLIKVPWLFKGYLEDVDHLEIPQYFSTGDIACLDDEYLYITGRKKDLIIKGGLNISPRRLEDFFIKEDVFEETAVIGVNEDVLGEQIVCCFVKKNTCKYGDIKEVNQLVFKELGKDYCVDIFFEVDVIPKNVNGKVDKNKLKIIYDEAHLC